MNPMGLVSSNYELFFALWNFSKLIGVVQFTTHFGGVGLGTD